MEGGHEGSLDGHMPAVISLAVGQLSSGAEDVVRRPVRCRGRPRYDGGPYRVQMISRGDGHRLRQPLLHWRWHQGAQPAEMIGGVDTFLRS